MRGKMMLLILAVFVLTASTVFAAPENASVNLGAAATFTGGVGTADSDAAVAGEVNNMNVSGLLAADEWTGYFGEVSGNLTLGYNDEVFYQFGEDTGLSPLNVFASTDGGFDFTGDQAIAAGGDLTSLNTDFSLTAGQQGADAYKAATNDPPGDDGATWSATTEGGFETFVIREGAAGNVNNYAFGAEVVAAQACSIASFGNCEYELMVPSGQTYFFFAELS